MSSSEAKKTEESEFFEIERTGNQLVVRCLSMLDNWNIREFKALVSEAVVFQPLTDLVIDFQSQPVDSEYFQVIVQAAQAMKLLHKKLYAQNSTTEFSRSVSANGLSQVIHFYDDGAGKDAKSEEAPKPSSGDSLPPTSPILIVDDIQSVRSLLRTYLTDLGFQKISEAGGADEAIALLDESVVKQDPVRVVISDWHMPGENGLQLHKRMRGNPGLARTSFILLTVETEKHNVLKAFQEGVKYYLVKPFKMETIADKLREIWQKEDAPRG
jgi:two-component system chemotaxis response regulator CheY